MDSPGLYVIIRTPGHNADPMCFLNTYLCLSRLSYGQPWFVCYN